jgi:hypothetical protein
MTCVKTKIVKTLELIIQIILRLKGWKDTPNNWFFQDGEKWFKILLTLSMILRFNLKPGGYSIWRNDFRRPPYYIPKMKITKSRWSRAWAYHGLVGALRNFEDLARKVLEEHRNYSARIWKVLESCCTWLRALMGLLGIRPPVPARKEEDGLLLGFLCNPIRTHTI